MSLWRVTKGWVPSEGARFGIEVEVEGMQWSAEHLRREGDHRYGTFWNIKGDGSLRNNGIEAVSRGGIREENLEDALKELQSLFSYEDNHPVFSARTSTHVHVNVQDLTPEQVLCMYLLAAGVEPLMQLCIAPERRTNLFCLPTGMCYGVQETLSQMYHQKDTPSFLNPAGNIGKYSSINLGRLADLGTIEFRAHDGASDLNSVRNWCTVLGNVRSAALRCAGIGDVFDILSAPEETIREWLFLNCSDLKFKDGDAYCTLRESVYSTMVMAGSIKIAPVKENVVRYVAQSSITPANAAELYRHIQERGSKLAFNGFTKNNVPPVEILVQVMNNPAVPLYASSMDVYKTPQGAMFLATPKSAGGTTYALLYNPVRENTPTLPVTEVTFDLEVM